MCVRQSFGSGVRRDRSHTTPKEGLRSAGSYPESSVRLRHACRRVDRRVRHERQTPPVRPATRSTACLRTEWSARRADTRLDRDQSGSRGRIPCQGNPAIASPASCSAEIPRRNTRPASAQIAARTSDVARTGTAWGDLFAFDGQQRHGRSPGHGVERKVVQADTRARAQHELTVACTVVSPHRPALDAVALRSAAEVAAERAPQTPHGS